MLSARTPPAQGLSPSPPAKGPQIPQAPQALQPPQPPMLPNRPRPPTFCRAWPCAAAAALTSLSVASSTASMPASKVASPAQEQKNRYASSLAYGFEESTASMPASTAAVSAQEQKSRYASSLAHRVEKNTAWMPASSTAAVPAQQHNHTHKEGTHIYRSVKCCCYFLIQTFVPGTTETAAVTQRYYCNSHHSPGQTKRLSPLGTAAAATAARAEGAGAVSVAPCVKKTWQDTAKAVSATHFANALICWSVGQLVGWWARLMQAAWSG